MIEPYKGATEFPPAYLQWLEIFRNEHNTIPRYIEGSGTPEGVVFAAATSRYYDTAAAGAPRLYVKTTGSNVNTGWVAYDSGGTVVQLAAALTADASVSSGSTICEIAAVPTAYYRLHCYIKFSMTTTGNVGIAIDGAASVSSSSFLRVFTEALASPATPNNTHQIIASATLVSLSNANEWICEVNGMFQVDTAGTIHIRFSETTGAFDTAREGSILTLHRP